MFNCTSGSVDACFGLHLGAIPRPPAALLPALAPRRPQPMTVSAPSSAQSAPSPRPPDPLAPSSARIPPAALRGQGPPRRRRRNRRPHHAVHFIGPYSLGSSQFIRPFLFIGFLISSLSIFHFIDPHFSGLLHVPGISATQASCGKINRIVQNQHLCSPPLKPEPKPAKNEKTCEFRIAKIRGVA